MWEELLSLDKSFDLSWARLAQHHLRVQGHNGTHCTMSTPSWSYCSTDISLELWLIHLWMQAGSVNSISENGGLDSAETTITYQGYYFTMGLWRQLDIQNAIVKGVLPFIQPFHNSYSWSSLHKPGYIDWNGCHAALTQVVPGILNSLAFHSNLNINWLVPTPLGK